MYTNTSRNFSAQPIKEEVHLRVRQVQRWPWERIGRGKLLLRCVCSAAREALGCPRGEERGGGISYRHAHSLFREQLMLLLPKTTFRIQRYLNRDIISKLVYLSLFTTIELLQLSMPRLGPRLQQRQRRKACKRTANEWKQKFWKCLQVVVRPFRVSNDFTSNPYVVRA